MNTRASGLPLLSPKSNPGVSKKRGKKKGNILIQTPPGFGPFSPVKFEDITSSEGGGSATESEVEELVCENKPEPHPAMDPLDMPMHRRAAAVAVPATRGSAITTPDLGDDFVVKGHHLKMIQDNTFDGRYNSDPHKHIAKFNELCEMFKYGAGKSESVKLRLFPSSLTGDAKVWFEELEENTITTWAQMRETFIKRFFPPALGRKLLRDIRGFRQEDGETSTEAWARLKEMLRSCYGHGLGKENIIEIFFYGLTKESQNELDLAGGGDFMYKTTNEAYNLMEDKLVISLSREYRDNSDGRGRRQRGQVAQVESSSELSSLLEEVKTMADKIDKRMNYLEKEVHVIKHGCENCGGPHYVSDCRMEDVNYANYGYPNRGANWRPYRDNNRGDNGWQRNNTHSPPRQRYDPPKNEDEDPSIKDLLKSFISTQKSTNDDVRNQFNDVRNQFKVLTEQIEQGQRNQQAAHQDLERRVDRMGERNSNRPPGQIPSNTQPNPRPQNPGNQVPKYQPPGRNEGMPPCPKHRDEHVNAITTHSGHAYGSDQDQNGEHQQTGAQHHYGGAQHRSAEPVIDDFEIEDDEDEAPPVQTKAKTPEPVEEVPLKAYKPHVPYPQRLRKDRMREQYGKFCDMIKSVNINVPLVDLIAGMPNYAKFIKELVTNKGKSSEEQAAFLNTECSALVKNSIPPKLDDPGSFLIQCNFSNTYSCSALADLGASINLMPQSLYAKLASGDLKPTKMSIRLADRSFQYPLGIAENMLVKVGKFTFPVDFVILEMDEDVTVPLILGRPFLNTADAIIRVKDREISLGVGDERIAFSFDKAPKHSYSTNETCFRIDVFDDMFDLDVQEMLGGQVTDDAEEDEELEDFDPILKKELAEFEKFNPYTKHETSDPDLVLLELEYLINNPGASLSLDENCHGISHDPFHLFSLTCREKENILQEFEDIGDDTAWEEFKKTKFNGSKYDDVWEIEDVGLLISEARKWHDAWVKRNKILDVGKEVFLFGDHFGHESEVESVLFGDHVGKKGERNLDLYMKS